MNWVLFYSISFILLSVAATLFHFLYDFTKFAPFKILSPVNESVWEHSKILVMPFLIFSIVSIFIIKPSDPLSYAAAVGKACLVMQIVMIAVYYTYTGILGRGYLAADIFLAYFCMLIGLFVYGKALAYPPTYPLFIVALFAVQLICIVVFTFIPPKLPLFKSPENS